MSEQIKTTTVDQLPEAANLNGFYAFGYKADNPVGKRSVKVPIELLKGNKGDIPAIGANGNWWISGKDTGMPARGQDGDVTMEQLNKILEDMVATNPEDKYKTYIVTSFKNETVLSPTICGLLAEGNLEYLVKTKDYQFRDTSNTRTFFHIRPTLLSPNDVATIYANGTTRIELWGGTSAMIYSTDPKLTYLASTNSNFEDLNLNMAKYFGSINLERSKVKSLIINLLTNLVSLNVSKCPNLASVAIGSTLMRSINMSDATKVTTMTFPAFTQLETVNIQGTGLSKDVVIDLGNKWQSRIEQTAGVLILDKVLADQLTAQERAVFISKNITLDER